MGVRRFNTFPIKIIGNATQPLFLAKHVSAIVENTNMLKIINKFDDLERKTVCRRTGIVKNQETYLTKQGIRKIFLLFPDAPLTHSFEEWVESFIEKLFHERTEKTVLRQIMEIFKGEEMIEQYPVERAEDPLTGVRFFKIDLYFPRLKAGVEVGEPGCLKDKDRQKFIEIKLQMEFIRIPEIGSSIASSKAIARLIEIRQKVDQERVCTTQVVEHKEHTNPYQLDHKPISFLKAFLLMDPSVRKVQISNVIGKFTEISAFKKYFCQVFHSNLFIIEKSVFEEFGYTIAFEWICKCCKNIAKSLDGKCTHCRADYQKNRGQKKYIVMGMECI